MKNAMKLAVIFSLSLVLFMLAFPHSFLQEPAALAGSEAEYGPKQDDEVFAAVVAGFDLFSSLLQDVYYVDDSSYPVVKRAASIKDAIHYLGAGFQADLAESMANYYLGWDEELARLVVIPSDSIPLIRNSDRDYVKIVFITENHAVVQRIFEKCYSETDRYLYTIDMQKDITGWKINELSLKDINLNEELPISSDTQNKLIPTSWE